MKKSGGIRNSAWLAYLSRVVYIDYLFITPGVPKSMLHLCLFGTIAWYLSRNDKGQLGRLSLFAGQSHSGICFLAFSVSGIYQCFYCCRFLRGSFEILTSGGVGSYLI